MFRESAVERRGDLIPVAGSRRYSIPGIAHVRNTCTLPVNERKQCTRQRFPIIAGSGTSTNGNQPFGDIDRCLAVDGGLRDMAHGAYQG